MGTVSWYRGSSTRDGGLVSNGIGSSGEALVERRCHHKGVEDQLDLIIKLYSHGYEGRERREPIFRLRRLYRWSRGKGADGTHPFRVSSSRKSSSTVWGKMYIKYRPSLRLGERWSHWSSEGP